MASKLKFLQIITAIVIPLFSVIANDKPSDSDIEKNLAVVNLWGDRASRGDAEAQLELGWHNYRILKDHLTEARIKLAETYAKKIVGDNDNLARAALLLPSSTHEILKNGAEDDLETALVQEKNRQLKEVSENDAAEAKIEAEWLNLQNQILELTSKNKMVKEEFEAEWLKVKKKLLEENHKKANETFNWFTKASQNTKADALTRAAAELGLGFCYMQGVAVEKDEKISEKWFSMGYEKIEKNRISAEAGERIAQYWLAQQFQSWVTWGAKNWLIHEYKGLKHPEKYSGSADYEEAARWFKRAADQGLPEAQYQLGKCYEEGKGVSEDEVEAVKWYRKAAEQNFEPAQFELTDRAWNGKGIPKDRVAVFKSYLTASAKGDDVSKVLMEAKLEYDDNCIK
jgi:TPR repeat protein